MKKFKKLNVLLLIMALLVCTVAVPNDVQAKSSKKMSISCKKVALKVGQKKKLKIKNVKKGKKIKWVSSKKKVATVSKGGVVTAKRKGTVKITARVSGKKFTCIVKVTKPKKKVTTEEQATTEKQVTTEEQTTEEKKQPEKKPGEKKPEKTTEENTEKVDTRTPAQICMQEGHAEGVQVRTEPTCCRLGYIETKCSRCGDILSYDEEIPCLPHDYVLDTKYEPTCTKGGSIIDKCKMCGKRVVREQFLKLGHDYETKKVASTCSTKGYVDQVCKRCGDTQHRELSLNSGNHQGVRDEITRIPYGQHSCRPELGIFAWETKESTYCAGCGKFLMSSHTVPNITKEEYKQLIIMYGSDWEKEAIKTY